MESSYCIHSNVLLCASIAQIISVWPIAIDRFHYDVTLAKVPGKELAKTSGSS